MMDALVELFSADWILVTVSSMMTVMTGVRITSSLKRCMKVRKIGRRMDIIVYKMADRI